MHQHPDARAPATDNENPVEKTNKFGDFCEALFQVVVLRKSNNLMLKKQLGNELFRIVNLNLQEGPVLRELRIHSCCQRVES